MTNSTQAPLLRYVVEMTGHRDHSRLELSVATAFGHLIDIRRVRKLEFFSREKVLHVRPLVLLENGSVVTDTIAMADDQCPLLSDFPELLRCMEGRSNGESRSEPDGACTLWLPVRLDEKVVSCIEIAHCEPFSKQTLEVIQGIMDVYRNYHSLLDYSERDALTGLLNRKTFDEQFARDSQGKAISLSRPRDDDSSRNQGTQWLAVVDIDHFKRVNDRFGHVYGDEVLILVANLMRSSFRTNDRIFRFGGEEFVVLLRSVTLDSARAIFERFRHNVEEHLFPQVGRVTVSIGYTSTGGGAPVEILGRADQALYYAKENGRNRIFHYEELLASGALRSADVAHNDAELF
jgi:diguanylate cyclase (GGDEF)-like protein